MFTYFESRAGIQIGNFIAEGQIDTESVATKKSRFLIANTGWILYDDGIAAGRSK